MTANQSQKLGPIEQIGYPHATKAMQLQCTYTPEDLVEAVRAKIHDPIYRIPFFRRKVVTLVIWGLYLNFAWFFWWNSRSFPSSAYPWMHSQNATWNFLIPTAILITTVVLVFITTLSPANKRKLRNLWHQKPSLQQPQTITIDEAGICISNPLSSGQQNWAAYRGWCETQNLFVVLSSDRGRLIIPKRIASAEQVQELREMLASRITGGAGGFPVLPNT
jgi:hypothetical protein